MPIQTSSYLPEPNVLLELAPYPQYTAGLPGFIGPVPPPL